VNEVCLKKGSFVEGKLENGVFVSVLVDTGATKTLISENFMKNHQILRSLPVQNLDKPIEFLVANNETFKVSSYITFMLYLGDTEISVDAFICPGLINIHLVLGVDTLKNISAILDMNTKIMRFRTNHIPLYIPRDVVIFPGVELFVTIYGNFPKVLKNFSGRINGSKFLKKVFMDKSVVQFHKGSTRIPIFNNTNKPIKLLHAFPVAYFVPNSVFDVSNVFCSIQDIVDNNLTKYPFLEKE